MATVLPPPSKRQKVATAAKARDQQPVEIPDGLQRIQFTDADTNAAQGPVVTVSLADLTPKNLSLLLNTLLGRENSSERLPYRFYRPLNFGTNDVGDEPFSQSDIVEKHAGSTETLLSIPARAEAVFRVKAVTRCSASISGHGESILATAFSPASSSRLATGSGDKTARIWDCDTGTPMHTLKGHTGWVLAVAWSPDDRQIATGSMDNTVRLWDAETGTPLGNQLKGHTKWVTSLAWEPYHLQEVGRPRVASASKDFTVRIWDTVTKRADMALTGHKGTVWNASTGTLQNTLSAHAHWVNHLALSTDSVLRTGYFDHTGQKGVPDSEEAKRAKARERFEKAAMVGGGSQIIERLVSASDDFTMYLWEPSQSTKPLQRMVGHQKQVNHVTFSPDGLLIASAGFDNHVKLWSAKDGKFITTLRGHVGAVYQCCFSPDSRLLVSASKDTTLKAWDVTTGKLKEDLPGHKDEVFAVDWSPDGERVGSGGQDKAVRIWRH
ncbi:ribosome assembly [Elasticomyces elasticus]|nr:ribosome assembly [Elasticomyces elasticus]